MGTLLGLTIGRLLGWTICENGTFWAPNMNHHDMFFSENSIVPPTFPDEHEATQSRDPVYQCTCGGAWLVLHQFTRLLTASHLPNMWPVSCWDLNSNPPLSCCIFSVFCDDWDCPCTLWAHLNMTWQLLLREGHSRASLQNLHQNWPPKHRIHTLNWARLVSKIGKHTI